MISTTPNYNIHAGNALSVLKTMPDNHYHCIITSPPYYGLRVYNTHPMTWGDGWVGELGGEPSPESYITHIVEICREIRRVLRTDGTFWLNIGDSYWGGKGQSGGASPEKQDARSKEGVTINQAHHQVGGAGITRPTDGKHSVIKPKDLCLIPYRMVITLQEDGWYVRSDITWAKRACMPESVKDRPTCSTEKIWLLTKSPKYFYDSTAVMENSVSDHSSGSKKRKVASYGEQSRTNTHMGTAVPWEKSPKRNMRNYWFEDEEKYRLKSDLTPEQKALVLSRLAAAHSTDDLT